MLAGNGAFSPSSYDLLTTTTLTSSAASITFAGLGSYSGYKHLQIRAVHRASAGEGPRIRLNGDSGSNYGQHRLVGDGTSVSSAGFANSNVIPFGSTANNSTVANAFGVSVIDILDFGSSSKNTTVRFLQGEAQDNLRGIEFRSGVWLNTAAVTSVEISFFSASFVAGSRFSLYGLK